jgi:hypothetical protein
VRVTVASRLRGEVKGKAGRFFNAYTQLTTIEDLRVQFDILKTLKKDANSASIVITNLSERNRAEFQTLPAHVTLDAGHEGDIRTIFKGDIQDGKSRRDGTEWMTDIAAGTGSNAIKFARINRSFKVGANVRDMMKATADSMGLKLPKNAEDAREFLTTIENGVSLQGPSMEQLSKMVHPHGFSASIQDDQLVLLREGDTNLVRAVVVSQSTGMIGSPELGTPEAKGKAPILSTKMLLSPDIMPGGLIQVQSRTISGNFKVLEVRHTGDTHGQPWYSEIQARQL